MRWLAVALLMLGGTTASSCGYDGWVRYPCQEAGNWSKPECRKPACVVTGTCPDFLLPEGVLTDD